MSRSRIPSPLLMTLTAVLLALTSCADQPAKPTSGATSTSGSKTLKLLAPAGPPPPNIQVTGVGVSTGGHPVLQISVTERGYYHFKAANPDGDASFVHVTVHVRNPSNPEKPEAVTYLHELTSADITSLENTKLDKHPVELPEVEDWTDALFIDFQCVFWVEPEILTLNAGWTSCEATYP